MSGHMSGLTPGARTAKKVQRIEAAPMGSRMEDCISSPSQSPITRLRQQSVVDERVELLEQAPFFSVLGANDLQELAAKFYSIRYGKGKAVFREGEPAERLFLRQRARAELRLVYNLIVTVPMLAALCFHLRPRTEESASMMCVRAPCDCGLTRRGASRRTAPWAGRMHS